MKNLDHLKQVIIVLRRRLIDDIRELTGHLKEIDLLTGEDVKIYN
jgi:hypothetical protein